MPFPAGFLAACPCYGCVSDAQAAVFTLIDAGTGLDGCRQKGVNEATQGMTGLSMCTTMQAKQTWNLALTLLR